MKKSLLLSFVTVLLLCFAVSCELFDSYTPVAKPIIDTTEFVYTGKAITVFSEDSDYYTVTGNTETEIGQYTLTATLKDTKKTRWADGTKEPFTKKWEIKPVIVTAPDLTKVAYKYTGDDVDFIVVADPEKYILSGNTAKDKGQHTLTVKLKDKTHSIWSDTRDNADKSADWYLIDGNPVDKPEVEKTSFLFTGEPISLGIATNDNYVVTGATKKTEVGTYKAIVSLKDSSTSFWSDHTLSNMEVSWQIFSINGEWTGYWDQVGVTVRDSEWSFKMEDYSFKQTVYDYSTHDIISEYEGTWAIAEDGKHLILSGKCELPGKVLDQSFTPVFKIYEDNGRDVLIIIYEEAGIMEFVTREREDAKPFESAGSELGYWIYNYNNLKQICSFDGNNYLLQLFNTTAPGRFEYTKEGNTLSVVNAPEYRFYNFSDGTDEFLVIVDEVNSIIQFFKKHSEKVLVTIPVLEDVEYTGSPVIPECISTANYTVKINDGADAYKETGEYEFYTVSLTDKTNYTWADGTITDKVLSAEITRKPVEKDPETSYSYDYTGSLIKLSEKITTEGYVIGGTTTQATERNTYSATITPDANHCWTDGTFEAKTIEWKIVTARQALPKPVASSLTTDIPYDGEVHELDLGIAEIDLANYVITPVGYTKDDLPSACGKYSTKIKPAEGCAWNGGTSDEVVIDWYIVAPIVGTNMPVIVAERGQVFMGTISFNKNMEYSETYPAGTINGVYSFDENGVKIDNTTDIFEADTYFDFASCVTASGSAYLIRDAASCRYFFSSASAILPHSIPVGNYSVVFCSAPEKTVPTGTLESFSETQYVLAGTPYEYTSKNPSEGSFSISAGQYRYVVFEESLLGSCYLALDNPLGGVNYALTILTPVEQPE